VEKQREKRQTKEDTPSHEVEQFSSLRCATIFGVMPIAAFFLCIIC